MATLRIPLIWGLLLAFTLTAWTAVVHMEGIYTTRIEYADLVDTIVIIVPLVLLTLALLEQRRALGGTMTFQRGLGTGTLTALISAPPTVFAMWVYHHYVNPDWMNIILAYKGTALANQGVNPDDIAAKLLQLQQGSTDQAQITGGLIGTVVMGFAISFVVMLALKVQERLRPST